MKPKPATASAKRIWPKLASLVMLMGVAACAYALNKLLQRNQVAWRPGSAECALFTLLAFSVISLSASGWRSHLHAMSGERLSFSASLRQTSALLVGKYIPGMVAGVAARILYCAPGIKPGAIIRASVSEQFGAILAATVLASFLLGGGHGWLSTVFASTALLLSIYVFPAVVALSHSLWPSPAPRDERGYAASLREAILWQYAQWAATAALLLLLIHSVVPGLGWAQILELTGWYSVSVVGGILAVFAPGGLGVREFIFLWPATQHLGNEGALVLALVLRLAMTVLDLLSIVLWWLVRMNENARKRP